MRHPIIRFVSTSIFISPFAAHAQDLLDPLVLTVTASRTPEDVSKIPQSVTVVGQDSLERNQAGIPVQTLAEETGVWGVNVASQGSPVIRGQMGNSVLYLWDGVRINNGALFAGPNGFFNQFPIGALDRIEVERGSGSVQYGSDAIGGVINLLPKRAAFSDKPDAGGDIITRYGTNNDGKTEIFDFHAGNDKVAIAGGLTWQDIGDYSGPHVGTLESTAFRSLGGYGDIAWRPANDQVLHLSFIESYIYDLQSYIQSKMNASGVPRVYTPDEQRGIMKLEYTLTDLGPWSDELKAYTYYQRYISLGDKIVQTGDIFQTTGTNADQDVLGLGIQNMVELNKWKLVYGTDYRVENLASNKSLQTVNAANNSVSESVPFGDVPDGTYDVFDSFATLSYRPIQPLLLTLGGRYEHTRIDSNPVAADVIPNAGYSISSLYIDKTWDSFTWNAGALYSFNKEFDLALNANSAFRTPTYSDLLSTGTPVYSSLTASIPSPNLKPVQSESIEIGPRYHTENFKCSVAAYYTHMHDMIVSTATGTVTIPGQGVFTATQNINDGDAFVAGIEVEASYKLSEGWTCFGNGAYTYGENTTIDDPLRFIPPLNGRLGIRYQEPAGRWWAEIGEVMACRLVHHAPQDQQDAGFSTDPGYGSPSATNPPLTSNYDIPGYVVTNVRGGFRVWDRTGSRLDVTIDINNLFNTSYREAYAQQELVAPGFGVVVGAKLTF